MSRARASRFVQVAWSGGLLLVALVAVAAMCSSTTQGAFSAQTSNAGTTLAAAQLDSWVPTAVSTSRTGATTCLVSWTPAAGLRAGASYDVTDGVATLASGVVGSSTTVTVPASAVTPRVHIRYGGWVSTASTSSAAACVGYPDAPVVSATPSEGQFTATWSAPSGNGAAIASYTATTTPASTTCTVTVPDPRSCTFAGLTNGVTYSVSVTATNAAGTGPAGTTTAVPYPDSIMAAARLVLWLDGADAATILASPTCTGAAATTAVGCWRDKSTNANHVSQTGASDQPVLAAANGHQVPSYDGSSDHLTGNPALLPTGTSSSTVIVAGTVDPSVAMNGISAIAYGGTAGGSQRRITSWVSAGVDAFTTPQAFASPWPAAQAPGVVVGEFASGASMSVWANGDAGATSAGAYTTGGNHLRIGAGGDAAVWGHWKGTTSEILIFNTTLTSTERRQMEEYLARKWGGLITPGSPGFTRRHTR